MRLRRDGLDAGFGSLAEILLAFHDHAAGELGSVNNGISQFAQEVRDCSDMVIVAMGDDDAADIFYFIFEIGGVGNEVVNAGHIFFRELEPHVYDNDVILVFVDIHGTRNLSAAPEGYKAQKFRFLRRGGSSATDDAHGVCGFLPATSH